MSICKRCGKEYLTKECLNCKGNNHRYNQGAIDSINIKKSNSLLKSISVILFILMMLLITVGIYEIRDLKQKNEILNETIQNLQEENKQIKRSHAVTKRLIDSYKKDIRELSYKARQNTKYVNNRPKNNTKKINEKNSFDNVQRKYYQKNKNKAGHQNTTVNKSNKKIYQKFSNSIQLISDSKITQKSDNRLTSTAQIYGRFYPKDYSVLNPDKNQISNIRCGLKNNRYGVVDECSMEISENYDKVYLGEMGSKSIRDFNNKTHMIECDYSKKYGIMHSCKKKLYKKLF